MPSISRITSTLTYSHNPPDGPRRPRHLHHLHHQQLYCLRKHRAPAENDCAEPAPDHIRTTDDRPVAYGGPLRHVKISVMSKGYSDFTNKDVFGDIQANTSTSAWTRTSHAQEFKVDIWGGG
ncbi:hypothetical protein IMZ48_31020, partial [Candidatus Bathyarchaeota archaeon]|nr:hypothetical protein [Candidatus Bathyarchaeota archaeon]